MNLVSLCLKIPNLGILLFYLIFIVIIPYLLIINKNLTVLKFYLPMLIAFANLLSHVGDEKIFKNLYALKPDNFVSFLSSNFINLFALFGILWQCLEYSKSNNGTVTKAVIYGAMLFIIAFPFARNGLVFILENVDYYLREKTELTYDYNWHLLVFGLLYIIFLLGFQAIILALVDSGGENNTPTKKYQTPKTNYISTPSSKPSSKSILTPIVKKTQNNVNKLLKNSTLSNLTNISKLVNNVRSNSGKSSSSNSGKSSSSSSTKKRKVTRRIIPLN
jgi:hypothetical protein